VVTGSNASVTVSASTGNGAVLSGTSTTAATSGVVTYSGLKFTGLVGDYTLTFASTGLTSATQTVTLLPAAANKLGINRSASGAVNAVAFTTQPKVSVLDIDGNVVTTSTASIGAAVVEAGATLAGTTPVAAVAGTNTFAGLKLTGTVGTYTLRYTSTGLTSVDDSITITYGAADHLAISTGATGIVNRVDTVRLAWFWMPACLLLVECILGCVFSCVDLGLL
jgi:hypothetical protein